MGFLIRLVKFKKKRVKVDFEISKKNRYDAFFLDCMVFFNCFLLKIIIFFSTVLNNFSSFQGRYLLKSLPQPQFNNYFSR